MTEPPAIKFIFRREVKFLMPYSVVKRADPGLTQPARNVDMNHREDATRLNLRRIWPT